MDNQDQRIENETKLANMDRMMYRQEYAADEQSSLAGKNDTNSDRNEATNALGNSNTDHKHPGREKK